MNDDMVVAGAPALGVGDMTAGMLLRQAREARGLHVAALAVAMKVPVKKLEALEADRLEDLPDAVFVRALAGSVCRALKLDPAPILAKLPQSAVPRLDHNESGIRMPAQGSDFLTGQSSLLALASRPSVLLVALLLAAALAVVVFPEARTTGGMADLFKGTPAVASTVPTPAPAEAAPVPVAAIPVAPTSEPEVLAPPVAAPLVAVAPVAAAAPVVPPAPARIASATVQGPGAIVPPVAGLLVFKASAKSWVRVSDSKGALVFEKTLAPGETAAANGAPPLLVVVGNVSGTEVLLRGQPYRMEDANQDNVARFEVK